MSEPAANGDILIFQTAFLGDALLGIPLYKTLRQKTTGRLVLLCRAGIGSFFLELGLVDEIIEVDKSRSSSWSEAKRKLAGREFGFLICPHESFRSALFARRIRADRKIGFKRFFNFFIFDERIRRPMELPEALRQLSLLRSLDAHAARATEDFALEQKKRGGRDETGDLIPVPFGTDMKIPLLMDIRNAKRVGVDAAVSPIIEPFANTKEPIIALAPGSVWRTKMWTKEGFIEAGRNLVREKGAIVVVMGSRDEQILCQEIASAIPNAVSLAGRTTLRESAELLAVSDLLICNDSGAMHLGAAAGVPIVSVFGPTVLEFGYRPWSSTATVVQTNLACRPCGAHGPQRCPLGHHNCMKFVDAADVVTAAHKITTPSNPGR